MAGRRKGTPDRELIEQGQDALESLRDGNGPAVVLRFANDVAGVKRGALALPVLRAAVEHLLRIAEGSDPALRAELRAQARTCTPLLLRVAVAATDEPALELVVAARDDDVDDHVAIAHVGATLSGAKHDEAALRWLRRARAARPPELHDRDLLRFGLAEMEALRRTGADREAQQVAHEILAAAARTRAALDPADEYRSWRERELAFVEKRARKLIQASPR